VRTRTKPKSPRHKETYREILQEGIHTRKKILRLVGHGFLTRFTSKDDNAIGQVRGHNEVVFDQEQGFLGVEDETERRMLRQKRNRKERQTDRLITLAATIRCSESR
jgi:hypothetical protein